VNTEEFFRNRIHTALDEAIGEIPDLAPLVEHRIHSGSRGRFPLAAQLAATLAILFGGTILLFSLHHPSVATPNVGTSPPTAQLARDSISCALPVEVTGTFQNPGQNPDFRTTLGFVNIPAGTFRVDPNATVQDLPGSDPLGPRMYSAQLKRWLPADSRTISPDGRSYAYTRLLPEGATYSSFASSELHVVAVPGKIDHRVWSYAGSIDLIGWSSAGILAGTVPPKGGARLLWRVDPRGGGAARAPNNADPTFLNPALLSGGGSSSYLGGDASGRVIFRFGSRDPGTHYSVSVVDSGKRTEIYSGTAGDATDFDPGGVSFDAHGIWFGNIDGTRVWLWSTSSKLQSFKVIGLPPAPQGYTHTFVTFGPVSACVPGQFVGVPASAPPPAPIPSPSPVPSPVDWSALTAKPLNLQPLASGAACPISATVDLQVKARVGKWPNYGLGRGPIYASGQFTWYSGGPQGFLILTDPKYTGPVLVRSQRLDGAGSLTFIGDGTTALANGAAGIAQTSSPPYWGTWAGSVTPSTPGCYGIQFDGTNVSDVVVIAVTNGPPPPG
jgi:hypothetical protein